MLAIRRRYRSRLRRIVNPWRIRTQNARTRADSSAKPTTTRIPTTVKKNSVKRGCEAKKLMSNAGSLEKSGGLGNIPCVNAKPITSRPMNQSKTTPVESAAAIAG